MPASRARRLCPEAIYPVPDFASYRCASAEAMGLARSCSETVEVIGLEEAYVELPGLRGSIGIGANNLVAKVASTTTTIQSRSRCAAAGFERAG
ncbi:MAG: hypothetical protein ACRDL5_01625 [Solirubrobacteraceae bacterium]